MSTPEQHKHITRKQTAKPQPSTPKTTERTRTNKQTNNNNNRQKTTTTTRSGRAEDASRRPGAQASGSAQARAAPRARPTAPCCRCPVFPSHSDLSACRRFERLSGATELGHTLCQYQFTLCQNRRVERHVTSIRYVSRGA
eukprot:296658-Rhodomonas_salina.3